MMNFLRSAMIVVAIGLGGCVGTGRQEEPGRYDFGLPAGAGGAAGLNVGAVEVQARSWLAGSEMQYRLGYADPARRYNYADSRWAAAPAELLEGFLAQQVVFRQPHAKGAGCRLRIGLEDLTQEFDDARVSRVNLEASAVLMAPRGDGPLSKRAFHIRAAAPTPDARGGVQATRQAVQALAADINAWLAELASSRSQDLNGCL